MLLLGCLSLGIIGWLLTRQLRPVVAGDLPAKLVGSCPACRQTVESGWLICPDCLQRLRESCPECGESRDSWFAYCPWCGHAAGSADSQ